MNKLLYQHINNHIMAYKSITGEMPNAILLPAWIYEELEKEYEKSKLRYIIDAGEKQLFGLDIIVTEEKEIRPLRIVKVKGKK